MKSLESFVDERLEDDLNELEGGFFQPSASKSSFNLLSFFQKLFKNLFGPPMTTLAIGEEGTNPPMSTLAIGEEGGTNPPISTLAIGEE